MIPWSYSRLEMFESCPKKFQEAVILKRFPKAPQSPQQKRGEEIHKHLEDAIKGAAVAPDVRHMTGFLNTLTAAPWSFSAPELEICYGEGFTKRGWWDKDVWLRIKIDFVGVAGSRALVYDWKTGKVKDPTDQLELYAAAVMTEFPRVEQCTTAFMFVDFKSKAEKTIYRNQVDYIWHGFCERAEMIQIANETNDWPAKPSKFGCRWCPVADCEVRT